MTKALLVGDIHLSDRPPSLRTETYAEDILAKLRWIVEYANEHADLLVLLGDVFHVKAPSRTSHALVQRTAEVLGEFCNARGNSSVIIVPGNHDMSQDRVESLPSQPLGSLALAPNVELIDGMMLCEGGLLLLGIPYLHDFDDFKNRLEMMEAESSHELPDLIVTHASIFPPGEHPPYDHMNMDEIDTCGVPLAFGHIHDSMGFVEVDGTWFCNNGAISRGSLHEETVKRQPKVTLFDSEAEGCPFTSVAVPHRPAAEVFRLDVKEERDEHAAQLDDFMDDLGGVALTTLSMEEVMNHARTLDLSGHALAELADIIESTVH